MNDLIISPKIKAAYERVLPIIDAKAHAAALKYGLTSLIAGGFCRDTTFGVAAKDVDVFLDISGIPSDEADDIVLLVADETIRGLKEDLELVDTTVWKSHETGYNPDGEKANRQEKWVIYDTPWQVFGRDEAEPVEGDNRVWIERVAAARSYGAEIQFIGRPAPLAEPEKFVEDFDYSLVKAWFDRSSGKIAHHPDFLAALESKEIVAKDRKAKKRIDTFLRKTWKAPRPFVVKKDYPTTTFSGDPMWEQGEDGKWRRTKAGEDFYNQMRAQADQAFIAGQQWAAQDVAAMVAQNQLLRDVEWRVPPAEFARNLAQPVQDALVVNDLPRWQNAQLDAEIRQPLEPAEEQELDELFDGWDEVEPDVDDNF